LIIYRKAPQLRIVRATTPEPPFWQATTIAPYSARRGAPVAIDYLDLTATFVSKLEVAVAEHVREELERTTERQPLRAPVLIDASEFAELVFRRGDEIAAFCAESAGATLLLISTRGVLPEANVATLAIAAWPLEFHRLQVLFEEARRRGLRWGVAIPVVYPVTTNLAALEQLAELAKANGASFFASMRIDLDATAKHAVAESLAVDERDETYDILFHADLDAVHVTTERHIAALADHIGVADFIVPPNFERKSNWNGAVVLTLAASRMMAMKHETELAWTLTRSARLVAQLEKPIERIAEAASLSIVGALDEVSVDILTEWIETGKSSFVTKIDRAWRMRRDAGMAEG
jgi:hypothetical protein